MKKILSSTMALFMIFSICFIGAGKQEPLAKNQYSNEQIAPINRDAVIDKLVEVGKLSPSAGQDEITAALKRYVGNAAYSPEKNKLNKKREAILNKKIETGMAAVVSKGNSFGTSKNNTLKNAQPISYGQPQKTAKVLVLLADFADYKHNQISKPDLSRTYWTEDFNRDHYQKLLFGDGYYTTKEGIKSPTFKQYFKEQSNGNLNVEGDVFGWYTASQNAKYYGEDSATSHNIHASDLIVEIAKLAAKDVDLTKYDIEDPYDLDNDGNLNEPDGMVDHLMVIYAGIGQEDGGGILGDDAIWSHSSSVGPIAVSKKMKIYDYTTEAENGAVGVFAHEFVHDLGMPDDYDTQYTADGDIVEYWSIMASGSWSGTPGGTQPTGINPYSRILLGLIHGGSWINWNYRDFAKLSPETMTLDTATMNTGNTQAFLISLPKEKNKFFMNKPAAGAQEFWGGTGSEIDHNMTAKINLTGKTSATLYYDIWYDIEKNWDAGFIQVSEDGKTFKSLSTPNTTSNFNNPEGYPTILSSLPAYTGNSNGWLKENIDLTPYAGKTIYIRFRYATDWGTENYGMFVDNITITADGTQIASEGAENGFGNLVNNGFETSDGYKTNPHYYVGEWRSYYGVDEGLKYNARAKVQYNQGMALWYINKNFSDNWVGIHPGYGQLGIVDSTQYVYLNAGLGNGNENGLITGYMPFVQLHDAAFSLDKSADVDFSVYSWAKTTNLPGMQANPLFDDSQSYLSLKSPYSGLKLPNLGLKIRVTGKASDYSRGEINIQK